MRKIVDKLDMKRMLELYERPLPTVEVGRIMGCSRSTIDRALKSIGKLRIVKRTGPLNAHWRGGRYVQTSGYVMVQSGTTYRTEHRVVMEKKLKRKLLDTEVVHHKNGIRSDNRPENLELHKSNSDHIRQEHRRYPHEDIVHLYLQGLSCRLVAEKIGCSPSVVNAAVKEAGKIRSRKEAAMLMHARRVGI